MDITEVKVRKIDNGGKLKGVASITISNEFVVHDIKILEGKKGLYIAMPSKKNSVGDFVDIAHPVNMETRTTLSNKIITAYKEE